MTSQRAAAQRSAEAQILDAGIEGAEYGGLCDPYEGFCATVALRQLTQWLPFTATTVLDLSLPLTEESCGDDYRISDVVMTAGHEVVTVARDVRFAGDARRPHPVVSADPRSVEWIRDQSFGAVVAEGGALSDCLVAEETVRDIARILRPGGRVLASADSLVHGLATLAEQHRWSELADTPAADVVLVRDPARDDMIRRCFSPDELQELMIAAGLEVEWIRPRTVLPPSAVRETLLADPAALGDLVISELQLADSHEGEPIGTQLVVSARKPR